MQCQTGLASRTHVSVHRTDSGAFNLIFFVISSLEFHDVSLISGPMLINTRPSLTCIPAVVTDSPSRSGMETTTGIPGGVTRLTFVKTLQVNPRPSTLST